MPNKHFSAISGGEQISLMR